MRSIRRGPTLGLTAIVALLGIAALATPVIGKPRTTVVHDPKGDGGAFEPGTRPGYCDVVEATSKLAKRGRLRQTVTTRGPLNLGLNAPPVIITRHRVHGAIGLADYVLSPGETGVRTHLRDHRRTVVYYIKRSVIANAVDRDDKYFWVVDQCTIHDDRAPNNGSASQPLRPHHHHHHHHRR
jgi:hypothetical protein